MREGGGKKGFGKMVVRKGLEKVSELGERRVKIEGEG